MYFAKLNEGLTFMNKTNKKIIYIWISLQEDESSLIICAEGAAGSFFFHIRDNNIFPKALFRNLPC